MSTPQRFESTRLQERASIHDSARLERLKLAQLQNLARQALRAPVPVVLTAAFIGFLVRDSVPWLHAAGWIALIVLVLLVRGAYAHHATAGSPSAVDQHLRVMVALSLTGGIAAGLGSVLFLPHVGLAQKAILTMLFVGWSSGAVAINAAYSPTYFAYVIPMLTPLAALWAISGTMEDISIGLLIVMFIALQIGFVRDNDRIFRESFAIRYENERLIQELESQRREVLAARDRAEAANRAKSSFLAAASHDLRQPLHAISLYSAALSVRNSDERTRELATRIGLGIASLGALLNSLLDISRLDGEAVHPEPTLFAVDTLVARLVADFRAAATAKNLTLQGEAPERVLVHTDALLLERILGNLLDNAIKYTEAGSVKVRVRAVDQRVLISVTDTGSGIPEHEHERVFEEFYQLSNPERDRSRGLGLGLAIVQRLTQLLGIGLELRSKPDQGTAFTIALPRPAVNDEVAANNACETPDPAELTLSGLHVLVVDDEVDIRHGMQVLLESWGARVSTAGDVRSALSRLQGAPVDVIVADVRLRGEQSGLVLAEAAKNRHAVPVLLISGDMTPDRLREAAALGLQLLHKPVGESELRRALAQACCIGRPIHRGEVEDERNRVVVEGGGATLSEASRERKAG